MNTPKYCTICYLELDVPNKPDSLSHGGSTCMRCRAGAGDLRAAAYLDELAVPFDRTMLRLLQQHSTEGVNSPNAQG